MTIGILCLDGLDHRLVEENDVFRNIPAEPELLTNDLDGKHPLFTPRVWTDIFAGEIQQSVTGWLEKDEWERRTEQFTMLWEKCPSASVMNLNVHPDRCTISQEMPPSYTPTHQNIESARQSALQTARYWNWELAHELPLQIGYWRYPDALGHMCIREQRSLTEEYEWIRDTLLPKIEFSDPFVIISDHGFCKDPESVDAVLNSGRDGHRKHGVLGSTIDLPDGPLTEFIPEWHNHVLDAVRGETMEHLGYR